MRLTEDRVYEMRHALEQRMMIGGGVPGATNGEAVIYTADAEFPAMIIDVSNQLYAAHWVDTFGDITYRYVPGNQDTPHEFTIQVGDNGDRPIKPPLETV